MSTILYPHELLSLSAFRFYANITNIISHSLEKMKQNSLFIFLFSYMEIQNVCRL
jgi:hypothetical protein